MTPSPRSSLKQLAMATLLVAASALSQAATLSQHTSARHHPVAAAHAGKAPSRAGATHAVARHHRAKASAHGVARVGGHHAAVKGRATATQRRLAARHHQAVAKPAGRHPAAHATVMHSAKGRSPHRTLSHARHPTARKAAANRVR